VTNIYDNPKRFNAATLEVIEFLDGDVRTGKCLCPCHDDGQNPSLQISNGTKVMTVVHCWGLNNKDHNLGVIAYLRANGAWPTANGLAREGSSEQAEQIRSPEDRRRYARTIWNGLSETVRHFAPLLGCYLEARGIKDVPVTARATMPPEFLAGEDEQAVSSDSPGMVLPVRNAEGKFQGIRYLA
jgi:hypothetical protein